MSFSKLKQKVSIVLVASFISVHAFPAGMGGSSTVEVEQQQGQVQAMMDRYGYQVASGHVSAVEAQEQLAADVNSLLDNGVSSKLIQNIVTRELPVDVRNAFRLELEALKAQGASRSEIMDLTYRSAVNHADTGLAFSSGSSKANSKFLLIGLLIVVVLINMNDDDEDTVKQEDEYEEQYEYDLQEYNSYNY